MNLYDFTVPNTTGLKNHSPVIVWHFKVQLFEGNPRNFTVLIKYF